MAYGGGGNKALDDYVPVHTRIEQFRVQHPNGRILTTILEGETLTVRAEIYFDGSDVPNATAHASEDGGMAGRKSSALEKTETAAVGRALAFCGYEVKEGIASREEMQKAQRPASEQREPSRMDKDIRAALDALGKDDAWLNDKAKQYLKPGEGWQDLPETQKRKVFDYVSNKVNSAVAEAR